MDRSLHQQAYLPHPSQHLSLDPPVPSSGSTLRENNGSFPVASKKRNRDHANSEDDLEEPPRKLRRSMRHPIYIPVQEVHSTGPLLATPTDTPNVGISLQGGRNSSDSTTPTPSTASNPYQQLFHVSVREGRERLTTADSDTRTVSAKTQKVKSTLVRRMPNRKNVWKER